MKKVGVKVSRIVKCKKNHTIVAKSKIRIQILVLFQLLKVRI